MSINNFFPLFPFFCQGIVQRECLCLFVFSAKNTTEKEIYYFKWLTCSCFLIWPVSNGSHPANQAYMTNPRKHDNSFISMIPTHEIAKHILALLIVGTAKSFCREDWLRAIFHSQFVLKANVTTKKEVWCESSGSGLKQILFLNF